MTQKTSVHKMTSKSRGQEKKIIASHCRKAPTGLQMHHQCVQFHFPPHCHTTNKSTSMCKFDQRVDIHTRRIYQSVCKYNDPRRDLPRLVEKPEEAEGMAIQTRCSTSPAKLESASQCVPYRGYKDTLELYNVTSKPKPIQHQQQRTPTRKYRFPDERCFKSASSALCLSAIISLARAVNLAKNCRATVGCRTRKTNR